MSEDVEWDGFYFATGKHDDTVQIAAKMNVASSNFMILVNNVKKIPEQGLQNWGMLALVYQQKTEILFQHPFSLSLSTRDVRTM